MRIGRAIIIPAILALGVAGSTVAGSAIAVAAGHGTSVHVQSKIAYGDPNFLYHA